MADFSVGQKVMHPLHGIGTVEQIEEKKILGTTGNYSIINFTENRLKIMVNLSQENTLIRDLISTDEVPKVFDFLKNCKSKLPARSSERYNINMKKVKSADIYQLAEVIKDLTDLSKKKKLSQKEKNLLRQTRKILSKEVSFVSNISEEEAEEMISKTVKAELELE